MNKHSIILLPVSILATFLFSAALTASVIITEIMPDPESSGEWIEIYNYSPEDIDLDSWSLIDRAGNRGYLPQNAGILNSNSFAILAKDSLTIIELAIRPNTLTLVLDGWASLNNDGDELALLSQHEETVDKMSYGAEAASVKGRTWERIDFEKNGQDAANWGRCAAVEGHTAGAPNSLYVPSQLNKLSIFISPNPFSPDGDGIDDIATISFNLPVSTSRIRADIYDIEAHLVCQLASNLPACPSLPTLQWDGKTDSGETLPVGRYIVYIESLDYNSGTVSSGKKVIVLAR